MTERTNYLSTHQAAEWLGLSTRTLDRYRVSGDGPVFHRFGGRVRYLRADRPSRRAVEPSLTRASERQSNEYSYFSWAVVYTIKSGFCKVLFAWAGHGGESNANRIAPDRRRYRAVPGVGRMLFCRAAPALFAALCLAVCANPSRANEGAVIRCPDWQVYAPPVVLARTGDGQTAAAFAAKTRPVSAGASPKTPTGEARVTASDSVRMCTYQIAPGDTLSAIAAARLGRAGRWPELRAANPGINPTRLRVGTRLTLPCSPDSAATQPAQAGTNWLARIFSTVARAPPGANAPTAAGAAGAVSPIVPAKPRAIVAPTEPPPLPVWTAKRGEYLIDVLTRWGKTAGYIVISDTADAWKLELNISLRGTFGDVVGDLVKGLAHEGRAPPVRLYPNKVVKVGL